MCSLKYRSSTLKIHVGTMCEKRSPMSEKQKLKHAL